MILPLTCGDATVDVDGEPVAGGSNAAMDVIRTHRSGLPQPAGSAYDGLPQLIESAREASLRFGVRARITGRRSQRCGLWHYVALPVLRSAAGGCPCCGGERPVGPFGVCGLCAEAEGWAEPEQRSAMLRTPAA